MKAELLELIILAHRSGVTRLMLIAAEGASIHSLTALIRFGSKLNKILDAFASRLDDWRLPGALTEHCVRAIKANSVGIS